MVGYSFCFTVARFRTGGRGSRGSSGSCWAFGASLTASVTTCRRRRMSFSGTRAGGGSFGRRRSSPFMAGGGSRVRGSSCGGLSFGIGFVRATSGSRGRSYAGSGFAAAAGCRGSRGRKGRARLSTTVSLCRSCGSLRKAGFGSRRSFTSFGTCRGRGFTRRRGGRRSRDGGAG